MKPLCSVCALRIWKISSCLRRPVAPITPEVLGDLHQRLDGHLLELTDPQAGLAALGRQVERWIVGDVGDVVDGAAGTGGSRSAAAAGALLCWCHAVVRCGDGVGSPGADATREARGTEGWNHEVKRQYSRKPMV